jgi:hypothetical protein
MRVLEHDLASEACAWAGAPRVTGGASTVNATMIRTAVQECRSLRILDRLWARFIAIPPPFGHRDTHSPIDARR